QFLFFPLKVVPVNRKCHNLTLPLVKNHYLTMKIQLILLLALISFSFSGFAQYKKDATPDMRYRSNKTVYGGVYSSSSTYINPSVRQQSGYYRSNGTYVQPHMKTNTNTTNHDNLSTKGNYNYYNGTSGTRARDYSPEAYNYGSGKTIYSGPKGGQYYYN